MPDNKFQKGDEASSTDRLLETIRASSRAGKRDVIPDIPISQSVDDEIPEFSGEYNQFKHKPVTIGVSLGYDRAFLVLIAGEKNRNWKILDHLEIVYSEGLTQQSPEFPAFLGIALKKIINGYKKASVWSLIPSTDVEIKYLKIPRVAKDKITDAAYWTFKKGSPFDEKTHIFDYEVIGETIDKGVEKTEILAYTVRKRDVTSRKNLFKAAGVELTGITVVALAFQNYLNVFHKKGDDKNACLLFIGKDWARIDIYSDGFLTLSRDIKTSYLSMVEAVADGINHDEAGNLIDPQDLAFRSAHDIEAQFISYLNGTISYADYVKFLGSEPEHVIEMLMPVLDRLGKQIQRTLEFFGANYNHNPVENIFVSGLLSGAKRILAVLDEKVRQPVVPFDPFKSDGPLQCLVKPPEMMVVKDQYSPAFCMALSHGQGRFNFLNTQKDKADKKYIKRFNMSVAGLFILAMLVCLGYYGWQQHTLSNSRDELARLQGELGKYATDVDKNKVTVLASRLIARDDKLKSYIRTYAPMALICEVTKITPENVYLNRFTMKRSGGSKKSKAGKTILMDGFVLDNEIELESTLAEYMLNLSNSPLIEDASVKNKSFDTMGGEKIIRFTAFLEIIDG